MKHLEQAQILAPGSFARATSSDETETLLSCVAMMRGWVQSRGGAVIGPMALEHLATGGKYLRAVLALRAGRIFGVDDHARVGWAAACELAHNATLVHDDLQDGDTHRRGQLTCWKRHGMAQAINVGDLMLVLPAYGIAKMTTLSASCRLALTELMADRMADVISGQGLECQMTAMPCPDMSAYELMVRGKTSALFELPVLGAALAGGLSFEDAQQAAEPFGELGIIFQMQDDCIDLIGKKGRDEVGSDLKEGKVSAVVVQHIADFPESRDSLLTLLLRPRDQTSSRDVEEAIAMFVEQKTIAKISARMRLRGAAALQRVDPRLRGLFEELMTQILAPSEPSSNLP